MVLISHHKHPWIGCSFCVKKIPPLPLKILSLKVFETRPSLHQSINLQFSKYGIILLSINISLIDSLKARDPARAKNV